MRLLCDLGFFARSGGFRALRISKFMLSEPSIPAAIASQSPKMKIDDTLEGIHEHSRRLSNFSLHLRQLQAHFLSIERMIDDRLKSLEATGQPSPPPPPDAPRHPELKPICARMDYVGLNSFVRRHRDNLRVDEVVAALLVAPDPAQLVLNSMQRFYPTRMRNLLVDSLASISPEIKEELRKSAKLTAEKWRATIGKNGEHAPECFAFLQFLALFRLAAEFDADELVHRFIVHVPKARVDETITFCRVFGLSEKVPDVIRKLVSLVKHPQAVNYAYAFDLVGQFPPVPLLRDYLKECKKLAQEVWKKDGPLKAQSKAIGIELKAHREVIKLIEEHNLDPECPLDTLVKEIEHLEKEKAKLAPVKEVIK